MSETMLNWGGREYALIELAAEMADERYIGRYTPDQVVREIAEPAKLKPDWWKAVPDGFKRNWDRFSNEFKLVIFVMACIAATGSD